MKNHAAVVIIAFLALVLIYGLATEESRLKSRVIGVTAICKDGNFTTAPRGKGACSGHGGIKKWYD